MTFTVTWKPSAKRKLAEIWLQAADPAAVSQAANALDFALRTSPTTLGESRSGNLRFVVHGPLAVLFEVHALDRRVDVLSVRPNRAKRF